MGVKAVINIFWRSNFDFCCIDNIETFSSNELLLLLFLLVIVFLTGFSSSSSSSFISTFLVVFFFGFGVSNSCIFFSSNLSYSAAFTSISFVCNALAFCASSFNSHFFNTAASLAFFKFSNCFSVNIRFGIISGLTSCLISSCVSSSCAPSGSISGSGTGTGSIFLFSWHYIIYIRFLLI